MTFGKAGSRMNQNILMRYNNVNMVQYCKQSKGDNKKHDWCKDNRTES